MFLCGRANGVNGAIFRIELPKRHVNINTLMRGVLSLGPAAPGAHRRISTPRGRRKFRASLLPIVIFNVWNVKKYGANVG